jgi:hypothetical protein
MQMDLISSPNKDLDDYLNEELSTINKKQELTPIVPILSLNKKLITAESNSKTE